MVIFFLWFLNIMCDHFDLWCLKYVFFFLCVFFWLVIFPRSESGISIPDAIPDSSSSSTSWLGWQPCGRGARWVAAWLGLGIGDEQLSSYVGNIISHYKDPGYLCIYIYTYQPTSIVECHKGFDYCSAASTMHVEWFCWFQKKAFFIMPCLHPGEYLLRYKVFVWYILWVQSYQTSAGGTGCLGISILLAINGVYSKGCYFQKND